MRAAKTIKRIRKLMCMEMSEFGELLGVTKQTIWHYEKGTRNPKLSMIRKIMATAKKNKIDVSVSDFLIIDENKDEE